MGHFGYLFIFLCSGAGKGEFEAPVGGGGCNFLLKIPGGGGGSPGRGGGARGRESVCGDLGGGGRLNIFFRGRNSHQAGLLPQGVVRRRSDEEMNRKR